jgi:hypothetical protein
MTMPEKIWLDVPTDDHCGTWGIEEVAGRTSYTLTSIMDTRIAELEAEVERLRDLLNGDYP